jgi:hypothetical protein
LCRRGGGQMTPTPFPPPRHVIYIGVVWVTGVPTPRAIGSPGYS